MEALLSQEDLNALQEDGVLLPGPQAGKRKISASFLLTHPSLGSSSATSTISSNKSTASVRYCDTHPHQDVPDFPDKQESAAALEYIGLQPATAKEIFDRWQSHPDPDQNPDELLDYVYGHISRLKQTTWQGYSDAEALQKLGVAPWLRSVLLDPRFKDIYETETLRFWLNETFRGNYRSIATIQEQLKAYVKDRKNKKKNKKRASIKDAFQSPPGKGSSSSEPTALAQHVATISLASDSGHLPQTHISIGAAEPILPNHKMFCKAKAVNEMSENHMFIAEDGSINMEAISSYRGGDFNPVDHAWYWTPEYETAVKYRDWAVHCIRSGEVDIPSKFSKYRKPGPEQTDIMLGNICSGITPKIAKIRPNEVQTMIDEDKVLKIENKKATQWVVVHEDVAEKLAIQARGKMHIEIFSAMEPKDQ